MYKAMLDESGAAMPQSLQPLAYRIDGLGTWLLFRTGVRYFFLRHKLLSDAALFTNGHGVPVPQPWRESDHSLSSNIEFKNSWSHIFIAPCRLLI
jgi:hypothetical protein